MPFWSMTTSRINPSCAAPEPTLHREYGLPIAVNVGDGMLAMAIQPLLDNIERVG